MTLLLLNAPADHADDRATPLCPHFGPCGGCQLQHLAYSTQLARKSAHLGALLQAAGLTLPPIQLHPSPPFAYRNRIRLTLRHVDGLLRAGYLRNATGDLCNATSDEATLAEPAEEHRQPGATFLPITQCPIAAPILWSAAQVLLDSVNQDANPWLHNPHFALDQLELFTAPSDDPAEGALQFTLFVRTAVKNLPSRLASPFQQMCETVHSRLPQLTGASIAILPPFHAQRSRRADVARPGLSWGSDGLLYPVPLPLPPAEPAAAGPPPTSAPQPATNSQPPETSFWVPRNAFFQINRFLLPELLTLVLNQAAQSPGRSLAWDLYAGVGLFSRVLARTFTQVTAVEAAEPAFASLAAPAQKHALPNLHAIHASTLDFLRRAVLQRDRPSFIVLDPPRSGAGPEVCALLARIAAPTLACVSCSPQTLSADLALLIPSGYTLTTLHLLDLFPQTAHIETLAILTRAKN